MFYVRSDLVYLLHWIVSVHQEIFENDLENTELFNLAKSEIEILQKEQESTIQDDKALEERASEIQIKLDKVAEEKKNISDAKEELEEEGKYLKSKFDEQNEKHEKILRMNREVEQETQRLNSEYKSLDDDKFEILVNTNEFVTEEGSELLKVFIYQISCKSVLIMLIINYSLYENVTILDQFKI